MKYFFAFLLILTFFSVPVRADDTMEVFGTVTAIDYQAKTFDVKANDGQTYSFVANAETDVDIENQNYRQDRFYQLIDMRKGDWVQVEYYPSAKKPFVVDDVDIFR